MKQGMAIPEFIAELKQRQERVVDMVLDTRLMSMLTTNDNDTGNVTEGYIKDEPRPFIPSQTFHRQMGTHLGIRADLYDRLRTGHPGLYDHLVSGLLREAPSRNLIRTYRDGGGLDGTQPIGRAFLGERYLRIDNLELAQIVAGLLQQIPGATLDGGAVNVSEDYMHMKVIVPSIERDLQDFWSDLRREHGQHHIFPNGEGPVIVHPGFVVQNSEVGKGALRVSQLAFMVRCSNGMIVEHKVERRHVGTIIGSDGDEGTVYKSDTVKAIDNAIRLKVRDAIQATVDETNFDLLCRQFAETRFGAQVEKPIEAMQVLAQKTTVTESEANDIATALIVGGDMSRFGVINAITSAAQGVPSFDRSQELEELASTLMGWNRREWEEVATAA